MQFSHFYLKADDDLVTFCAPRDIKVRVGDEGLEVYCRRREKER